MNRTRSALALFLILWLVWPAAADTTTESPAKWTINDILLAESAGGWTISPNGTLAAWTRSTVVREDGVEKRISNLWLSRLDDGQSLALTHGRDSMSQPAFSPDGRHLAFLTNRSIPGARKDKVGTVQVWVIPVAGGEAFPVTRLERSARGFGWTAADKLVVMAQESPSAWEIEHKKIKDTSIVVDDADHEPPVRLFTTGIDGTTSQRLTLNTDWISSLDVAPDGKTAVVTSRQSLSYEFDQKVPPQTFLVDTANGKMTRIFTDGKLLPGRIRWSADSRYFYLVNPYSRHPLYRTATINQLWRYEPATGRSEQVDLHWDRGLGGNYAPVSDGVVALLADGVRFRPALITRRGDGWQRTDLTGTHIHHLDDLTMDPAGHRLAYRTSSATTPPQWYGATLDGTQVGGERKLTDLNKGYAGKPTGRVEVVHWKGARGDEVEGLLHYPLDWQEGQKRPLILSIHGGPTGVDRDTWSQSWAAPMILWRQRGAFVFEVNYHGSIGYGLDWVESIGGGKYYELEVPDILSGVDELIRRGLVDPDRLGSTGWSNGGILTAALITETTRFKAASVGAADVEWFSDWANVDFGASFDNYYFGGPPWEIPQVYLEKSPFFRLARVTTPTIIYTGTKDRNVPPHESWSLFRALQQIGKAPARLVLFPDEPHGLRQIVHQRRKVKEDLQWFDRYLFGTAMARNEAVEKGSPLAGLLARYSAAKVEAAFGVDNGGILVPETVTFQGMEIGRFEVTRAQYAVFDPDFPVTPGTENLPATGITFDRARAYTRWLAERTGRPFRLPIEVEAKKLAAAAGHGGNTLDHWAGYAPNPDDLERLRAALSPLGSAPLLLPVGSLPGSGDPMVFDLNGNAAEWAIGTGDTGVAVGPSADRPTDPLSTITPAPAYTGFRVIVSPAAAATR